MFIVSIILKYITPFIYLHKSRTEGANPCPFLWTNSNPATENKLLTFIFFFFSFNKYIAISSRTVRSVLKDDLKVAAEKRNETEVKVAKALGGGNLSAPEPLKLTK